jgi:hypothetical protein
MATILAQKATADSAVAKSDEHHELLAADPTIPQFPQGSTYGSSNTTTGFGGSSAFGTGTPGFNQNNFNSPGFNQQPSISGFGSTQNINQSTGQQPVLTGASPTNAASGADILVANDKESEHWINSKWRPAMGWLYMSTCFADFILFPVLWSLLQALNHGQVTSQWQPLTLQGAGLYHIAMGAVLGIAAYGRTKEKVAGAN